MAKRILNHKKRRKSKISSWRKLQLSRQLKRRLKILALALMVVVSTAAVFAGVSLYHYLTEPLATAAGAGGESVVFSGGRFNLLLISLSDASDPGATIEELAVLTLNEREKSAFLVELPLEAEVLVPQGFGAHRLADVYALGALSKPQANLDLTVRTVGRLLAVPIDGYVLTDARTSNPLLGLGEGLSVRLLPQVLSKLRQGIKTNLTFSSLLRIGKLVWQSGSPGESGEILASELEDLPSLDKRLGEVFRDSRVAEERLQIQILNATDKPGLAFHVSRYVLNMGGEILRLGNFDPDSLENLKVEKSILVALDANSYTVKRLVGVLGVEEVRAVFEGVEERAEITLILGLDSFYNL